jgi:hypothetical protein
MTNSSLLLNDKAVAKLPYAADGQYKARDTEVAGFFVRVGKRSKTFMAEGEFWRDGVRAGEGEGRLGRAGARPEAGRR